MRFLGGLLKFLSILLLIIATVACSVIIAIPGIQYDQPDVIIAFAGVWVCALFVVLNIWGTGMALSKIAGLNKKVEQLEQRLMGMPAAQAPTAKAAASAAPVVAAPAPAAEPAPAQEEAPTAEPSAPAAVVTETPAKKKPLPKWMPVAMIGGGIAIIVIVAVVLIAGGKKDKNPAVEQEQPAMMEQAPMEQQEAAVVEPPMEEEIAPETSESDAVMVPLGEFIENEHFNMTFDSINLMDEFEFRTSDYSTTSLYVEDGYKLLVLQGHFANHGTAVIGTNSFNLQAVVNGEYYVEGFDVRMDFLRSKSFEIDPYTDMDYVIYVNIPEKLAEMYENVVFTVGFNADMSVPVTNYNMDGTTTVELDNRYSIASDAALMEEMAALAEDMGLSGGNGQGTPAGQVIGLGETIVTPDYEFTLLNVETTYEVLPPNTNGVYSSYAAESGKVYVHIEADIKNTMQRDIRIDELFEPSCLYDEKYPYSGFVAVVDDGNRFDWVGSYVAATPLETCQAHGIIECPAEVDESGKPILVYLQLGDTTYEYPLR